MTLRQLPAFASEEEEANWWFENREQHAEDFVKAFAEGRVKVGRIADRIAAAKQATAITLCAEDALKAVRIADEKKIDVQTYLAELIHDALKADLRSTAQENSGTEGSGAAIPDHASRSRLLER